MRWFNYRPVEFARPNAVLPQGVLSINPVTGKFKIGDNHTPQKDLPEFGGGGAAAALDSHLSVYSNDATGNRLQWQLYNGLVGTDLAINGNPWQIDFLSDGVYAITVQLAAPGDAGAPVDFNTEYSGMATGYLDVHGVPAGEVETRSVVLPCSAGDHFGIDAPSAAGTWADVQQTMDVVRLS